jgi:hypothetical protein
MLSERATHSSKFLSAEDQRLEHGQTTVKRQESNLIHCLYYLLSTGQYANQYTTLHLDANIQIISNNQTF